LELSTLLVLYYVYLLGIAILSGLAGYYVMKKKAKAKGFMALFSLSAPLFLVLIWWFNHMSTNDFIGTKTWVSHLLTGLSIYFFYLLVSWIFFTCLVKRFHHDITSDIVVNEKEADNHNEAL